MQPQSSIRKFCWIYLSLVPFITFIVAFTFGHSRYQMYLPIWFVNACFMVAAAWTLGLHVFRGSDPEKKNYGVIGMFLFTPWIFISVFGGMGPLPPTIKEWLDTITEQHIRYIILIVCGVIFTAGFALLWDKLRREGEHIFSILGFTGAMIKIPLFILSMTYLGGYLIESFKIFVASDPGKRPDWYLPLRTLFSAVSFVEVGATWLAGAAFAASIRKAGWVKPVTARIYILFSILGFACSLLPTDAPGALNVLSYLSSIPAVSLIIPHLMGVNIIRRAGQNI